MSRESRLEEFRIPKAKASKDLRLIPTKAERMNFNE